MGKSIFFPILICFIVLSFGQGAFAALFADQTVIATLAQRKSVITNGGNINVTIDPTTGTLSAALTPGFTLITNSSTLAPVALTSTINTSGGTQNAFFGDGTAGNTFLMITNSAALPTPGAVANASSGSPTPASNANVIVYPVNIPSDVPGQLVYVWDNLNQHWNGTLTHKGNTNTLLTIPAVAPRTNTFSIEDLDGAYQATIILSFV